MTHRAPIERAEPRAVAVPASARSRPGSAPQRAGRSDALMELLVRRSEIPR